jgi:hypothetical protein
LLLHAGRCTIPAPSESEVAMAKCGSKGGTVKKAAAPKKKTAK